MSPTSYLKNMIFSEANSQPQEYSFSRKLSVDEYGKRTDKWTQFYLFNEMHVLSVRLKALVFFRVNADDPNSIVRWIPISFHLFLTLT